MYQLERRFKWHDELSKAAAPWQIADADVMLGKTHTRVQAF